MKFKKEKLRMLEYIKKRQEEEQAAKLAD